MVSDAGWGYTHTQWDLLIAHPPCTYLTVTGNRWFDENKYGKDAKERQRERYKAIVFFMKFALSEIERVAIENPIGIMSSCYKKPTQIIEPWMFGDKSVKHTCLWLKGLKPLEKQIKKKPEIKYHEWTTKDGKKKRQEMWYYETRCLPHDLRAKQASKTFPGIAKAMAEQWG